MCPGSWNGLYIVLLGLFGLLVNIGELCPWPNLPSALHMAHAHARAPTQRALRAHGTVLDRCAREPMALAMPGTRPPGSVGLPAITNPWVMTFCHA